MVWRFCVFLYHCWRTTQPHAPDVVSLPPDRLKFERRFKYCVMCECVWRTFPHPNMLELFLSLISSWKIGCSLANKCREKVAIFLIRNPGGLFIDWTPFNTYLRYAQRMRFHAIKTSEPLIYQYRYHECYGIECECDWKMVKEIKENWTVFV